MKNKFFLLTIALLIILPMVAGCGRTTVIGDKKFLAIPHPVDFRFENCNVCHAAEQLNLTNAPFDHSLYNNSNCLQTGCHSYVAPTTTPPATTTPPTGTATEPPTGTTTTTGSAPVLDIPAKALVAAFHPAAYATVCMLCHAEGVGVQQYPMAPSWPGTPVTPGPWTITPGSDADHTGRTDVATCTTQSGCHTMPK